MHTAYTHTPVGNKASHGLLEFSPTIVFFLFHFSVKYKNPPLFEMDCFIVNTSWPHKLKLKWTVFNGRLVPQQSVRRELADRHNNIFPPCNAVVQQSRIFLAATLLELHQTVCLCQLFLKENKIFKPPVGRSAISTKFRRPGWWWCEVITSVLMYKSQGSNPFWRGFQGRRHSESEIKEGHSS